MISANVPRDLRQRRSKGFTLMEMLVVLVLIGLIAAVAVPQIMKLFESAKHKAAKIQLETLSQSLHYYELDMNAYPTSSQGLKVLWEAPPSGAENSGWNGPYVRRPEQLVDPWGRPFLYKVPGTKGAFDLVTYGADGKEGGRGDDADLIAAP